MTPSRTREVAEELARQTRDAAKCLVAAIHGCTIACDDGHSRDEALAMTALHAAEERGRVAGRREALEEAAKVAERGVVSTPSAHDAACYCSHCHAARVRTGVALNVASAIRSLIGGAK